MTIDITDDLAKKFDKSMGDIFTPETAKYLLDTQYMLSLASDFNKAYEAYHLLATFSNRPAPSLNILNERLYKINKTLVIKFREINFDINNIMTCEAQKQKYDLSSTERSNILQQHLYGPIYRAAITLQESAENWKNYEDLRKQVSTDRISVGQIAIERIHALVSLETSIGKLEKDLKIKPVIENAK